MLDESLDINWLFKRLANLHGQVVASRLYQRLPRLVMLRSAEARAVLSERRTLLDDVKTITT